MVRTEFSLCTRQVFRFVRAIVDHTLSILTLVNSNHVRAKIFFDDISISNVARSLFPNED